MKTIRIADALRDELARRASRRGLHPVDLAVAVADLPGAAEIGGLKHAHIEAYFAGRASMVSAKVALLARVLGLRFTEDIYKAPETP